MPRRWMASGIRRVIFAMSRQPYDILVFETQRARLYPRDNRTEKKVFTAPQFWDVSERQALHDQIRGSKKFVFVDAGANVGLYSLAVRALCLKEQTQLQCLAIEPDPVNGQRLAENIRLNNARDIQTTPIALSDTKGTTHFRSTDLRNRGEAQVVQNATIDTIAVEMQPLLDVLKTHQIAQIDALKIDIEGLEEQVLSAFFGSAPQTLLPKTIILETVHNDSALAGLMESTGYIEDGQHGINSIYRLLR